MFSRQRRRVAELAVRAGAARTRVERARARFERARSRFLGNPVNLLLPFTAGALSAALALYRKPPDAANGNSRARREGVSLRSLITTGSALWSATATLRESLRAARFEPPAAPDEPPAPTSSMPPPGALEDAPVRATRSASQPTPPA